TGVRERKQARAAVLEAASEVARPTVFALAIIIVAYIPIFSLQRVEGRIFAPMANTVCAALVAALVFSFTLIPVLAFAFLRERGGEDAEARGAAAEDGDGHRMSFIEAWATRAYKPALGWALANRKKVVAATLALLALGGVLLSRIGTEFLPTLNEG